MINFRELEERVLARWREEKTFQKSLENRKGAKSFVFYEGPPTANGKPHIGHVLVRAYKDVICRYKTMAGFFVGRKAGWDTHGLPVELEVEKQLGLKSKKDIEAYGIAAFNKKCKESVWTYKDEWEKLTKRIGFWLDMRRPYITYDPKYMESLWWIMKQIWEKGLLYQGHKVVPYCTRCGTGLSSHEVAQGYKEITENSVYVKFKLIPGQKIAPRQAQGKVEDFVTDDHTYILSWTTTPWTLPGNVALAVGEDIEYVLVEYEGENFILARERLQTLSFPRKRESREENLDPRAKPEDDKKKEAEDDTIFIHGKDLIGLSYEPLFDIPSLRTPPPPPLTEGGNGGVYRIYPADFVTTTDGTGVVHTAVMYGEDDYNLGVAVGLPQHHTVTEQGMFTDEVKELAGLYVKDKKTEEKILSHLKEKGLLLREEPYTHDYPFCWRCDSPLLYYAKPSWLIAMSRLCDKLIANNETINWIPAHIKDGRFGEWLREVKDWNFSRERYWGTPLPVWKCEKCGSARCVGSMEELDEYAYEKSGNTYWLMRHGEAENNLTQINSIGVSDPHHLTEHGKAAAAEAAVKLGVEGVDYIFSSDFVRTSETAQILGKELGVKPEFDERLRELNVGVFNGKEYREHWEYFESRSLNRFDHAAEGGETWADLRRRMMAFLADMEQRYKGKKILIVSHGDPLWVLERTLAGFGDDDFRRIGIRTLGRPEYPQFAQPRSVAYRTLPYDEDGAVNLHRPYVDDFFLRCGAQRRPELVEGHASENICGGKKVRVKDVVDVWFDSGAMPWAQDQNNNLVPEPVEGHAIGKPFDFAPLRSGNNVVNFPADYICEAIDQTRGWFYTLLAISTLLEKGAPYKNVISLAHVLDAKGQKMSKSRGNVVNPWDIIEKYGADALRWYFFTVNEPGDYKLFDEKHVAERMRGFLNTLWNCVEFYKTYYAETQNSKVKSQNYNSKLKNVDEEQSSQSLHILDQWVLASLDMLASEVFGELYTFEVTGAARALERFVINDLSQWYIRRSRERLQKDAVAIETLRKVLETVSQLAAPFVPFIADAAWEALDNETSVHLCDYPQKPVIAESSVECLRKMGIVRIEVSKGLALRAETKIKVRQPLPRYTISSETASIFGVQYLSQEYIDIIKDELNVKEVLVGTASELDTNITEDLKLEGDARELMRQIQDARKKAGLKPGEGIVLTVGDEAHKKLLKHTEHGPAILKKTFVQTWEYKAGTALEMTRMS